MKANKYFWYDLPLKADINRHRAEQVDLEHRIQELENTTESTQSKIVMIRTLRHFLCMLLQSKVEVLEGLGRNKPKRRKK